MAGSISLSMSQQFDDLGKPLSGGLLYFIEAGTTSTPQNAYQDSALTIAHPNPITLDSAGRVPQFYLADGSIKIRLTDSAGVQQLVADNVLVVGPSSGSGGGGSVDATTVLATGDIKVKYGTGTLSGFVRMNGRTIGSATSGATERANSDAQQLFEYLWAADANLTVSGGRGASANADWVANKTLKLPDGRGLALAGLDDMGNTAAGTYTGVAFARGDATTIGGIAGSPRRTLALANLPPYTPSGSISTPLITAGGLKIVATNVTINNTNPTGGGPGASPWVSGSNFFDATPSLASSTPLFTGNAQGGTSTPFDTLSPYMFITYYLKL